MLNYKTQIIKLQNGIDLIANVSMNNDDSYLLDEPMEFGLEYRNGESNLIMKHWLPVQLIKKNSIQIQVKDILSFVEPDDSFCEYYINTIEKIKNLVKAKNNLSDGNDLSEGEIQHIINEFENMEQQGVIIH
jgi:hypothetical protein